MGRNSIKNVALAAMAMNHVAIGLLSRQTWQYWILLGAGYITMPVMVYFLVQGFYGTRSRKKYALRLLVAALVSQPVFSLYFGLPGLELNMMFTLLTCFGILAVRNASGMPLSLKLFLQFVMAFMTIIMDWSLFAAVLTILFDMSRTVSSRRPDLGRMLDMLCFMALSLGISVWHAVGIPPFYDPLAPNLISAGFGIPCIVAPVAAGVLAVAVYDKAKDPPGGNGLAKYWFYGFYPAHLLVLLVIRLSIA